MGRHGRTAGVICVVTASLVGSALSWPAAATASITERVSVSVTGAQANSLSGDLAISGDGRYVAFYSQASNLTASDTNTFGDIFVRDRTAGTTAAVSVTPVGQTANFFSTQPQISANGRYIAFWSNATNIVPGVAPAGTVPPTVAQCYVRDMTIGVTVVASVNDAGQPANAAMQYCRLSSDGRYVAFSTIATNVVPLSPGEASDPDCGGSRMQVYRRDLQANTTVRVSVNNAGAYSAQCGSSGGIGISGDGRHIAFVSNSGNLGTARAGVADVWLRDVDAGQTELISRAADGGLANSGSNDIPSVSADGRFVGFTSFATNLVATDTNGFSDSFVRDRLTGRTTLVSVRQDGTQGNRNSGFGTVVSADGRFVGFSSIATNLVPDDTNVSFDAFVWERSTGALTRVSVSSTGQQGARGGSNPEISADGSWVAFYSESANLVSGDTNAASDVFVRGLQSANTPPAVTLEPATGVRAGVVFFGGGSFTDPDPGQSWTATADYGDGSGARPLALAPDKTFTLSHTWASSGTYQLVVVVDDGAGGRDTASATITVEHVNTVPVVLAGPTSTVAMAQVFARTVSFLDPDPGQTWTATVDYGDGTLVQPITVNADKTVELSHKYAQIVTLTVTVMVTDSVGATGEAAFDLAIVPVRSFIFVHGILGDSRTPGFPALLKDGLLPAYDLQGQVRVFDYFQDKSHVQPGGSCVSGPSYDPSQPTAGLPVDTSPHSLDLSYCDSQSDIGINAILLDADVRTQHEQFGGHVTIIANSMGGAITRAFLAYATAAGNGSADVVDDVYFIQGAQAGSYLTLSKTIYSATAPSSTAWTVISEAIKLGLEFDPTRPAWNDLTPRSSTYQWVNPDVTHLPAGTRYQNVATDIGIIPSYDIFGMRFAPTRITVGDLVMLPGSDDPRALPLLGGENFDPRVAGRGSPESRQWILRKDVVFAEDSIVPVLKDPSAVPGAVLAVSNANENHRNIGDHLADIRVDDGNGSVRPLSDVLLDRMKARAP
jgi:hypothetical protein